MIGFALFGAGRIGRIHAENIARHPQAQLKAVCDADPSAARSLAARTGAEIGSADEIFASADVDAIVVASPAETHAGLVERAARSAKAIFCEKPIDKDIRRTRECLAVVEASGVPLFMAFNRRFDPSFASLRDRLAAGEIGRPELVFLTSRDPAAPPLSYIKRSGGLFRDMMVHDFDVARWLLGEEPDRIFALGRCFGDRAIADLGFLDTAVVSMSCPSGTVVTINCAMRAAYGYDQRVEVHGSRGMLTLGNRYRTSVTSSLEHGISHELPLSFFTERYAEAYVKELDHFLDCLQNDTQPCPDGRDGLAALLLAETAHRSWQSGVPLHPADVAAAT